MLKVCCVASGPGDVWCGVVGDAEDKTILLTVPGVWCLVSPRDGWRRVERVLITTGQQQQQQPGRIIIFPGSPQMP